MKHLVSTVLVLLALLAVPGAPLAASDNFLGDSAIYSSDSASVKPNVLFVIDNSAGMSQAGSRDAYDATHDYSLDYAGGPAAQYNKDEVYVRTAATGGTINYGQYIGSVTTGVSCATAKTALVNYGYYSGPLKKNDGSCTASQPGNYYTGNLLNYINAPSKTPMWEKSKVYAVGDKVKPTTEVKDANGVILEYECVAAGTSGGNEPIWPKVVGDIVPDTAITSNGTAKFALSGSIIAMVKSTLGQVLEAARDSARFGVMVFGDNNQGGKILTPVQDVGLSYEDKYKALVAGINGITLLNANAQPVNETFWDASLYYKGQNSSTSKIASEKTPYLSPIEGHCQANYVVLLTTGSTDDNAQSKQVFGDLNSDSNVAYADDGAMLLYATDHSSTLKNAQRVQTHVIQLLTPKVQRLEDAAIKRLPISENEKGEPGIYRQVKNAQELTDALLGTLSTLLDEDSAFVSPTIPASPENRSYSGSRIYLGFFKPITKKPWYGNLKKFGINKDNAIVDKNEVSATDSKGNFLAGAVSHWNNTTDAGVVDWGGVGEVLENRIMAGTARKIYSNLTTTSDLTSSGNLFNKTNVTFGKLDVADAAERDLLVDYVSGLDAYDEDLDGVTAEPKEWAMGDIRHSKPALVNYRPFDLASETNCNENKTMIFVGANDGMLHAFTDCNGEEAWAFIPDKVLPNLKELTVRPNKINYFVDASPIVMRYDANKDGTIDPASDKIVLIFGLRRGGNAYYALDVTSPMSPKLLWSFDAATSGFSSLGQSWSDPQFAKVRIGSSTKVLAFFGGGYDVNEDGRYGATGTFPATTTQAFGNGNVVSPGTTAASARPNPVGQGVYAVEVASLSSAGVPSMTTTPTAAWSYTVSNNAAMQYAFPSDLTIVDSDGDGLADKVYGGDTGGQFWRFNIKETTTGSWTGEVIFKVPTGSGQKFFYKPSVAVEGDYSMIALGSGDREHPLNSGVADRMYMIKDKGQSSADNIGEGNLMDVTANELQGGATTVARQQEILASLNASTNYGWMVKLTHNGEKVLASPLIINKVAYYTTYSPDIITAPDPCDAGNLGTSRLYALNYKTGEAALNFQKNNDTTTVSNERALNKDGKVLLTEDRVVNLGTGIPSGLTIIIPESGELAVVATSGGGVIPTDAEYTVRPQVINWRMW